MRRRQLCSVGALGLLSGCIQPQDDTSDDPATEDDEAPAEPPSDNTTTTPTEESDTPSIPSVGEMMWPQTHRDATNTNATTGPALSGTDVEIVWDHSLESVGNGGLYASQEHVIVNSGSGIVALNRGTGKPVWNTTETLPDDFQGVYDLVMADDAVYFAGQNTRTREIEMRAVGLETGEPAWEKAIGEGNGDAFALSVEDETLYIVVTDYDKEVDQIVAIDSDERTVEWKWDYDVSEGGRITDPVAVGDGTVCAAIDSKDNTTGGIIGIDAATGETQWEAKIGAVQPSPTIDDGQVFATPTGTDDPLYALALADGSVEWTFEALNHSTASVAVADGIVYYTSSDDNGTVYGAETDSGTIALSYEIGDHIRHSSPVLTDENLLLGTFGFNDSGSLRCLDRTTGNEQWRLTVDKPRVEHLLTVDGVVYFSARDSYDAETVYAVVPKE